MPQLGQRITVGRGYDPDARSNEPTSLKGRAT